MMLRLGKTLIAVATAFLLLASGAHAAGRVYWESGTGIFSANLDGSDRQRLETAGGMLDGPAGEAIDPVTKRIYWVNKGGNPPKFIGISFVSLDGTESGVLPTPGANFKEPSGLAIDPATRRVYWANRFPSSIWFASLDRPETGALDTTGAVVHFPNGVAVDPAARRIYWVNESGPGTISFANLDGSGAGGSLNTENAPVATPMGLAIDTAGQRVFWANSGTIAFAKLDGSGGGSLNTAGATVGAGRGVAIDPFAGRIYWAHEGVPGTPLAFANLDGSGGGNISTFSTGSSYPLLSASPRAAAPPAIAGGSQAGSVLTCSQGAWAPDVVEAFYYAAPTSFSYQWSRDGADLPGATQSSLTAVAKGEYRCRVTAENGAGTASQTSAAHRVSSPPPSPPKPPTTDMRLTLSLASPRVPARGPIAIRVVNGSPFPLAGKLSAKTTGPAPKRPVRLAATPFQLGTRAKAIVKLKLPKALGSLLRRNHKLPLALRATVTDPARNTYLVKQTVVPKLKT